MALWKVLMFKINTNKLRLFIIIVSFFAPMICYAFNLSVSVTGGSGSWSDGIYTVNAGSELTFSCTPSNGTAPYTYTWDFDDVESYKTPSTDQTPTHTFNYPGTHIVRVSVTDDDSTVEYSEVKLFISSNPTTTYCMIETCPSYPTGYDGTCDADSSGTVTLAEFRACLPSSPNGLSRRIDVPSGTYTFTIDDEDAVINGTEYFVLYAGYYVAIEVVGVGDTQPIIVFDNDTGVNATSGVDAFIYLDAAGTPSQYFLIENIQLVHTPPDGVSSQDWTMLTRGMSNENRYMSIINCDIQYYTSLSSPVNPYRYIKNNQRYWGVHDVDTAYTSGQADGIYLSGNSLMKRTYYANGTSGHSHLIYSGTDRPYVYVTENYMDGADGYSLAYGLHFYSESGTSTAQKYVRNNIIKNTTKPNLIGYADNYAAKDCEFINNKLYNSSIHIGAACNDADGGDPCVDQTTEHIIITGNHFQEVTGYSLKVGRDADENTYGITFTGNTYGLNAGSDGGGTIEYTTSNYSGTFTPNTDDTSTVDVSDPGAWEYTAPTISSATRQALTVTISATDGEGSGLTTTARFPYSEGAFVQVVDGNNNYSEIQDYAAQTTWGMTPTYVRVADVDHNLSSLTELTVKYSMTPGTFYGTFR